MAVLTDIQSALGLSDGQEVLIAVIIGAVVLVVTMMLLGTKSSSGDVSAGLRQEEKGSSATASNGKPLNAAVFKPFRLLESTQVSHNTKLLRFEIPGKR
jgi:hypothetical protein